jgi:hypothetical protein
MTRVIACLSRKAEMRRGSMSDILFNTEPLASRQTLLDEILAAINGMDKPEQPTTPLLMVFWGSQGAGKTIFLKEAEKRLANEPGVRIAGFWTIEDDKKNNFTELPELIRSAVEAQSAKHKVVILDNVEALLETVTGENLFEFESKLILPLIERCDTLILAGSQIELNQWQEYDVRFRQCNYHLASLSLDEVKQMLAGSEFNPTDAYRLTFGQPQMLLEYMQGSQRTEKEIARKAADYFLADLESEPREIARIASLLPAINIYVLRKIRQDDQSDDEGLLTRYHDHVNELTRRGMIRYDSDLGAYRFTDDAVRRLLALDYRFSSPRQYDEAQSIAAGYFEEEAKGAAFLPRLIVSAVYHQAQANRKLSQEKRGALCVRWIRRMRDSWNGANWEQVLGMWDSTLNSSQLREELVSLIGEKTFDKVTQIFLGYQAEMEA